MTTNRRVGLDPDRTAREMLQVWPTTGTVGVQPLPAGTPGSVPGASVGVKQSASRFFLIGDHGGVLDPNPQAAVVNAMLTEPAPDFVYTVGDVVYFHGDPAGYAAQFYEPYTHLNVPIIGVPGNHDGDVAQDDAGNPTVRQPLDTFMANFCTTTPQAPVADPHNEYGRDTQTQPYCDWALELDTVTIVGVYSNVPSGGHLEPSQIKFLTDSLASAPADRPLIVALHHPPYSVDAFHGGSAKMGATLDLAFQQANRWPNMVISGHVHDYQRFTRVVNNKPITYLVIGNSGYHNLHRLAEDARPNMQLTSDVTFNYGDASGWGFVQVEVAGMTLSCEYTGVTKDGVVTANKDTFTV